jgi:Fe-S cluster assembly protein SufD
MSAFLDSQAAVFASRSHTHHPRVQAWREAALSQALRVGFPHNKLERWKYAPLRALAGKRFAESQSQTDVRLDLPPAPRLVFVDGRYDAARSDTRGAEALIINTLAEALAGDDERAVAVLGREFSDVEAPFAALNTALAEDGLLIEIPEGVVLAASLHLVFVHSETNAGSSYLRHKIECREHSRVTLIEHHLGGGNGVSNDLWHVHVKPGAHLQHLRVQNAGSAHAAFSRCDAAIAGGAEYTRLDIDTGCHYQRLELNLALQGRHALARSGGVLWAVGSGTLDARLSARHQAPDTACELLWRGLAEDKGKVHFYGGITIDVGADGSNAALSNKNLLLGANAQVTTQPALEIHADEVKAAHGATVGQLDANALFYLRTRGVAEADALALLTRAFYAEALAIIDDAALRETLKSFLPARLVQDGVA